MDIMTEGTLSKIAERIEMQNALLAAIAEAKPGSIKIDSFKAVQELVQTGLAPKIFEIGDQFTSNWTDVVSKKTYEFVWDITNMGYVTLEDGSVVPGMTLEMHYLTPFTIQYDHEENQKATEETFQEGISYYTKNSDGSYTLQEVVPGEQIPTDTTYYHSAIKDPTGNICRWGYNRWGHSACRQYINSNAEKGKWWAAQHFGDVEPSDLNNRAGFLTGLEEEFLNVLKKVKIKTWLNKATDKDVGEYEETCDLFYLASKEQIYGTLENGKYNDEAWDYYKEITGLPSPNNGNNTGRIKYIINNTSLTEWRRLRSPICGNSYSTCGVSTHGNVNNNSALAACRVALACTIA